MVCAICLDLFCSQLVFESEELLRQSLNKPCSGDPHEVGGGYGIVSVYHTNK